MTGAARLRVVLLCLVLALAVPAVGSTGAASAPAVEQSAGRYRVAGILDVAAGGEHSCGIQQDRSLWCWGRNNYGQIGTGGTAPSSPPVQVGADTAWAKVTAGGASTCAIRSNAALYCWGLNHRGQIGDRTRKVRPTPTRVPGVNMWREVSMGFFHTCAVRTNNTLWCWGDNSAGQLGKGDTRQTLNRFKVPGMWSSVSAGGWTTCATKVNRTLWCWGRNLFGQLGIGSKADRHQPARVGKKTSWRDVAVSWTHACARSGGTVWCWGRNTNGQLGTGTTADSTHPRKVRGGHRATDVAVAEGTSCLVDKGSRAWCWGDNRYGQTGGRGSTKKTPVRRSGTYTSVSGGWLHLCGASTSSSVCWGLNERGQLGNGPTPRSRSDAAPATAPAPAAGRAPYSFRLASYNVLGNGHSRPYAHDDRFGPSRMRAEWMAQALTTGKIGVVGIQEPTAGQLAAVLTATQGRYASYPGPGKDDRGVESTLLWDTRKFEATRKLTIRTQFIAKVLPRPVVRLRHKASGRQFWVMNVHNAPWDMQGKRDKATKLQIAKIKELEKTGLPVFYIGDFNEKKTIHCKVLRKTGLRNASGGRITSDGRCVTPKRRMRVDAIFGSGFVRWSGFSYSRPPLVRLSTDHWVPVVDVQVP